MLTLRNIGVSCLSRDAINLVWEVAPSAEDVSSYSITVLRSESDAGPFAAVSPPIPANALPDFSDSSVHLHSKWRDFHYRLRVTAPDGAYVDFGSTDAASAFAGRPGSLVLEVAPDLEALEAARHFELALREFTGTRFVLLRRRSWGQRCPECWDSLKERQRRTGCRSCYDTSWAGGYFTPMEVYASTPPERELAALNSLLKLEPSDRALYFGMRPRVHAGDLLIDAMGMRWRILSVPDVSGKLRARIRQVASARALSRDQVEYEVPLTGWGVDSRTAAPARQYIRAMDIEEAAHELPGRDSRPLGETSSLFMDIEEVRSRQD